MKGCFDVLGPDGFGAYEVDWNEDGPVFQRVSAPPKGFLIPGFVDIHIHGAYGIDFMSATTEQIEILCRSLEADGYELFFATTVTAPAEDVLRAIDRLPTHRLLGGIHLEGPFISPAYPGAQPPQFISDIPTDSAQWSKVWGDSRLRMITLAPEIPNALELISRLMARGVRISMGHSNATWEEARRGYEFGAAATTHTFNAMRGFHHREAGIVGYALFNDDLECELIYDRLHVSREAAAVLLKSKPPDKVVAVSDSTMATGLPPGQAVQMWGQDCIVGKHEVRLAGSGVLAGSAITLLDAFKNLAEDFGVETAIRACCVNPRLAIGCGQVNRWLLLDQNMKIVDSRWLDSSTY